MFSKKHFKSFVALILICLLLFPLLQEVLDRHVCSDIHCTVCQIIRSLNELALQCFPLHSATPFLVLILYLCQAFQPNWHPYQNLVKQKVKITS